MTKSAWAIPRFFSVNQIFTDLVFMILLFISSSYVVYFTSQSVSQVFFLALLLIFLLSSKKDYLWFAFFLVIMWTPGYLFSDFSALSTQRLPLYTFLRGWSFTPLELFLLFAFLKALRYGRRVHFALKRPLILILIYAGFLFFISFFLYGTNQDNLDYILKCFINTSIFVSFSLLVYTKEDIFRFFYLFLPIVFFIFFAQIYFVVTGIPFVNLFNPGYRTVVLLSESQVRPLSGGIMILFLSYVSSLLLLRFQHRFKGKYFLLATVMVCYLSVFLSATRIWFIMFSFILVCYVLFTNVRVAKYKYLFFVIVLGVILFLNVKPLKFGIEGAWNRISEVGGVVSEGIHEAQTLDRRVSIRLPKVLEGIKQNWLIGWGFSDTYFEYSDRHVGNFDTILQGGLIGFLLFGYLWFSFFEMIFVTRKKVKGTNTYRDPLLVLVSAFGAILIAHFSTYHWFGLLFSQRGGVFLLIFMSVSELFVRLAKHEDRVLE